MPPCSVWGHPKVTMCCDEDSEARNWALQGGDRAVGTPPGAGPYPPPARFQFRSLLKVAGASRCSMKTNTVTSGYTGKEGSSVFLTNKIFWLTHVLTEDTAPDVTPQGKCMTTIGRVGTKAHLPQSPRVSLSGRPTKGVWTRLSLPSPRGCLAPHGSLRREGEGDSPLHRVGGHEPTVRPTWR